VLVGRDRIAGWTTPLRKLADALGRWRPGRPSVTSGKS